VTKKPVTVRQSFARIQGRRRAHRDPQAERGFYVAMETPERKSRRGRKPAAA